jgi:hypothetical protein
MYRKAASRGKDFRSPMLGGFSSGFGGHESGFVAFGSVFFQVGFGCHWVDVRAQPKWSGALEGRTEVIRFA